MWAWMEGGERLQGRSIGWKKGSGRLGVSCVVVCRGSERVRESRREVGDWESEEGSEI